MVFAMKKNLFFLSLILLTAICVYTVWHFKKTDLPKSENKYTKISLRQGWFPWAGYAGEMMAMYETDTLWGIDLIVDAGADDIDPVKMVLSGNNNFGITSAEAILEANQKGADLVAIAVINYKSPTCFISLKESRINSPKDFEGKSVGILTGSETETVYRTLKTQLKLNSNKIKEIEAAYDLKSFINKSFDVYPGFIYSEPLALDQQGIKYNIIKPEDYGVQLMGAVYFTTKDMVKNKPDIVYKFVASLADGWKKALNNPKRAISYLKKYDRNIDEIRETMSLERGKEYFAGQNGKILFADDASWFKLKAALVNLKKVDVGLDVKTSFDNSFINKYNQNQ